MALKWAKRVAIATVIVLALMLVYANMLIGSH